MFYLFMFCSFLSLSLSRSHTPRPGVTRSRDPPSWVGGGSPRDVVGNPASVLRDWCMYALRETVGSGVPTGKVSAGCGCCLPACFAGHPPPPAHPPGGGPPGGEGGWGGPPNSCRASVAQAPYYVENTPKKKELIVRSFG